MKQPIVLESNQNHATITDNGICPALPASMGMGGGYVPMIVIQRRFSNVIVNDMETSPCLEAGMGGGGNNIPMIVQTYGFDSYNQTIDKELSQSLRSNEGGDTKPKVIVIANDDKKNHRAECKNSDNPE